MSDYLECAAVLGAIQSTAWIGADWVIFVNGWVIWPIW